MRSFSATCKSAEEIFARWPNAFGSRTVPFNCALLAIDHCLGEMRALLCPAMTNIEKDIETLIREFATKLVEITEADMRQRAMAAVAAAGIVTGKAAPSTIAPQAGQPVKRTLKLSPKGMAARKLQGQYLGTLRGLSSANRIRVKKVARDQGVAAALKLASTLK